MKKYSFFLMAGMAAVLASCSSDGNGGGGNTDIPPISELKFSQKEVVMAAKTPQFAANFFQAALAHKDNVFGDQANGNYVVSPLSAQLSLAMVANCCDDATNSRIAQILDCDDVETLNGLMNKTMRYLTNTSVSGMDLRLANSLWTAEGYDVDQDVTALLNSLFYSQSYSINFSTQAAVDLVNGWVNDKTVGMIPELYSKLPENSLAMMVNALYLKGEWRDKFKKVNTQNRTFEGRDKDKLIEMMGRTDDMLYCYADSWQAVSLGYKGDNNTYMSFILPDKDQDIDEFAASFGAADIEHLTSDTFSYKVSLRLPKFEVGSSLGLGDVYDALGLNDGVVSLAKLFGNDSRSDIRMGGLQKTIVKIDEEGTVAAAVTSTEMNGASMPTTEVVSLIFNRPFLFMIHNADTGAVLMLGQISNL